MKKESHDEGRPKASLQPIKVEAFHFNAQRSSREIVSPPLFPRPYLIVGSLGRPKSSSNAREIDSSSTSAPPGHITWKPIGNPPSSRGRGKVEPQSSR